MELYHLFKKMILLSVSPRSIYNDDFEAVIFEEINTFRGDFDRITSFFPA